ncbi:MAG: DUF3800 domain-containing protein [Gammaproteobacteria bacterium]|nr:DUF3800 domain-containing protein [Gammaproteobacteria bacterium]
MTKTAKNTINYFVDEAGDPTLFNRKGHLIIGDNGCSNYFILGKMAIGEPAQVERALEALRAELLADPYFKDVPSMQPKYRKTAIAFYAKDDLPEIRREVFKLLLKKDLRFYAVVRDKRDLATYVQQQNERDTRYRYRQDEQYDLLVKELFRKLHHMADNVHIYFAKRGNKPRNAALRRALKEAAKAFERSFGFAHPAKNNVVSSTPPKCAGLQAVDYYLWALQRFYERREERFLDLIGSQVSEIHDLDRVEDGKRGGFLHKKKAAQSGGFREIGMPEI